VGSSSLQRIIQKARNASDLLMSLTCELLHDSPLIDQYALALQLQVRYKHPSLVQAVFDMEVALQGPWQVGLQQEWSYIDALWSEPLQHALTHKIKLSPRMLSRAIDSLVQQDALEQAISLALKLGAFDSAAQLLSKSIDTLMDRGAWMNLRTWISQIPQKTLHDWPWLIYTNGEINVVENQFAAAQKQFALATQRFQAKLDTTGICQSLLAESALASWQGEQQHAYSCAYHANDLAQQAGLQWYAGWAAWQLGCILAAWNNLDGAIAYFQQAITIAASLNNQVMLNLVVPIEELTQQQYQLHQKRLFFEQALAETQQNEQLIAEQLRQRLSSFPENLDLLLSTYGWSYTPLMAKLPVFPHTTAKRVAQENQNWWQRITQFFRLAQAPIEAHIVPPYTRPAANAQGITTPYMRPAARPHAIEHKQEQSWPEESVEHEQEQSWQEESVVDQHEPVLFERTVGETTSDQTIYQADTIHLKAENTSQVEHNEAKECILEQADHKAEVPLTKADRPALRIHCFGVFCVYQNDQEITQWAGLRGQAILKYLVAHHNQAVSKDILMDMFWSDASPDAARRNLHQAIYSLRQSLKLAQSDFQHILFEHNCYRLNPELDIWIDVHEFLELVQAGQRFAAAKQIEQASSAYYRAEELYQGCFLQDDLYEEWTHVHRERLQTLFINMLEWQIEQAIASARHAEVIALAQKLLQHDPAYECAHCQIMQAYVALGLRHRAIKQFQICKEQLREAYDLKPSSQTIALYQTIVQST
jgi:DNA-binding SARP family transcriptional activator